MKGGGFRSQARSGSGGFFFQRDWAIFKGDGVNNLVNGDAERFFFPVGEDEAKFEWAGGLG